MQTVIGSIKFDITPDYPVSLLGYFNDRVSTGVADPLFCRVLAIGGGGARLLIIQIDNCLIPTVDVEDFREKISAETAYGPAEVLICTTHTHTAPALIIYRSYLLNEISSCLSCLNIVWTPMYQSINPEAGMLFIPFLKTTSLILRSATTIIMQISMANTE